MRATESAHGKQNNDEETTSVENLMFSKLKDEKNEILNMKERVVSFFSSSFDSLMGNPFFESSFNAKKDTKKS